MKRFSCLSAISVGLVGLLVSTASFAAPPAAAKTVQPSDPTPSGGGTDPTAAPTTPAPTSETAAPDQTPNAAVTLGSASGAPGTDTPNASATEPAAAPKKRRWAGTQIFAQTSMTTATFDKSQQQNWNPTVDSALYITPRFAISDAFQLRGRIVFNYEYTNSDETVTKNEPRFSDTTLQLFYRKIPEIPGGIKPAVALNAAFPTSPESRARTLLFSPGASFQLSKTFEHLPGNGSLDLLASGGYSHPLYRSTTPEIRTPRPYAVQCAGGTACTDQLSGTFNTSDSITYTFLVSATWGKWSPALYYLGASQWAYTGNKAIEQNGRPVTSPDGFEPTNVRQSSYFSAWLDYEANSWLTAEVGYWLSRSALNGDSTRGNPFFDKYQDQRVYIGANFNIDNIMKQLEGGAAEAGIVRAQNKKPIGQF
ncbi:MAG TPA: hypothetical protein VLT33_45460 [Labilithrix sp.]|nr:hypothetical protein [Labilithrix sp.]